jgi:hypothetical protein
MRAASLALLAALSSPALAFDGLYRPDQPWAEGWDCQTIGMDGGALAVREGRFYGVENTCELTNPTAIRGMEGVLYDAVCSGEGETETYRMVLMRVDGGLAVIRDGWVNLLKRCD